MKDFKSDVKGFSNMEIVNYFYQNYIDRDYYFDHSIQFTMLSDRHDINTRTHSWVMDLIKRRFEDFYQAGELDKDFIIE